MDVCLKESGFDSYRVRNSVLIISHITFLEIAAYYELTMTCSPVDLISLRDRALRPFIARSGFDSRSSLNFFRFFFNHLGCLFISKDQFSTFKHCTLFWLKWPSHDLVLVILLHPLVKLICQQYKTRKT